MNNFRNIMRRMRQYTAAVEKNYNRREKELEKEIDKKGSKWYIEYEKALDSQIEEERIRLAKAVQKDLVEMIADIRHNVGNRITKAPTTDMVNALGILGMLDSVSPTEIKQYALQMTDCPLAMTRLQQIAGKHNMQVSTLDTDAMMRAVDVIEGNLAMYIQGFNGNNQIMSPSVKQLHDMYFQPEEAYMNTSIKSSENVDSAFWSNVVGIGFPAMLDADDEAKKGSDVQYFFNTLDGLLEFMDKETTGLEGAAITDKINAILADCPGQYGAAYRYYKATGQKEDLNQSVDD